MNLKDYKYVFTEEKTPHDVYDATLLKNLNLPKNFQIIDFRPPVAKEWFLADYGAPMEFLSSVVYSNYNPRLILKKLPEIVLGCEETSISVKQVYGGDVEIPEGYKFVDFRIPKCGENYIAITLAVLEIENRYAAGFTSPRIIVTKA